VDERLTSFTTHGFATTSVFAVLFLRKAFGMVTINGTFVFQGPFVSFYCHFSRKLCGMFFQYILQELLVVFCWCE
jgi:capsule polysaccharide modification protein KpsS